MSSMSSVAGLSKYITTLPKTEKSITAMFIISFISGAVYFIINPSPELGMVENIILGGLFSLIILGISSIIGGGVNQQIVSGLHGINLKIKHSMFLSALSMTIVCILLIIGGILTHFFEFLTVRMCFNLRSQYTGILDNLQNQFYKSCNCWNNPAINHAGHVCADYFFSN